MWGDVRRSGEIWGDCTLGRMSSLMVFSRIPGSGNLASRLPTVPYLGLARRKERRTSSSQNSKSSRALSPPFLRLSTFSSPTKRLALTVTASVWSDCPGARGEGGGSTKEEG